jgi:hypothetical protein
MPARLPARSQLRQDYGLTPFRHFSSGARMSSAFGIRSSFGFRKFGFRVNSSPAPDANHGFRESVRGGLERDGFRLTGLGAEITRTILVQALLRDTSNIGRDSL